VFSQYLCGFPSERLNGMPRLPRVAPWAGMRRPVGALAEIPHFGTKCPNSRPRVAPWADMRRPVGALRTPV